MKKLTIFAFAILIQLVSYSQSSNLDSLKNELSNYIEQNIKTFKTAGLSIALVDDQKVLWSEGFGYSDLDKQTPVTANTVFRIASVSKLFTGIAIMQLIEKKLIGLDNPITDYIPEFSIKSHENNTPIITIRHLMTHSSGLPSDIMKDFYAENPIPFQDIVTILKDEYLCFEPGKYNQYSNVGITLLGCIIERVSKMSFSDYMQQNVFDKMNMKNSAFGLTSEMEKLYTKSYLNLKEFKEPKLRDIPAGFMHSNVIDLANFAKTIFNDGAFEQNQVISSEILKMMITQQNLSNPYDMSNHQALIWSLYPPEKWAFAGGLLEHNGSTETFHAQFATLPKYKIGVIILTNSESGIYFRNELTDKSLNALLKYKAGIQPKKITPATEIELPYDKYKDYSGYYVSQGGELCNVVISDKKIVTQMQGKKLTLKYNNRNRFSAKIKLLPLINISLKDLEFNFCTIENHHYMIAYQTPYDSVIMGEKIIQKPIPEIWQKRLGEYQISENKSKQHIFTECELKTKEGFLILEFNYFNNKKTYFVLKQINDEYAIVGGFGYGTGSTLVFNNNIIHFSGVNFIRKL